MPYIMFAMKHVLVIFFVTITFCLGENGRIAGGENAPEGRFPFMASIRYVLPDSFICGGAIITKRTILTTARCLKGTTPNNVLARVGTVHLNTSGTLYKAQNLLVHDGHNENTFRNDIGLVIVDQDIIFTNLVQPIAVDANQIGSGVNVDVIGWGATVHQGPVSQVLKYLDSKSLTNQECIPRMVDYGMFIFESSICTLSQYPQDVCPYDFGGPVVTGNKIVGVLSWGVGCGTSHPTVSSRASFYASWIDANKV